jgi:hypothetical protein
MFLAVSLAKMRLGFLPVIPHASGMIPGPRLIYGILMHIPDENLIFSAFSDIVVCFAPAPVASLSTRFGFLVCAGVHRLRD